MCGIFAVFSRNGAEFRIPKCCAGQRIRTQRELACRQSAKQRHRGPDHTGVLCLPDDGAVFIQERLAVVCPETGNQPLQSADGNITLTSNGEIYNYLELSAEIAKKHPKYKPRTDCDVIIGMYEAIGASMLGRLSGMFAFALYDKQRKEILIARDPIGIIPMYKGEDEHGNIWVASEMKCLVGVCENVIPFPPGTSLSGKIDNLQAAQFYQPKWMREVPTLPADISMLHQSLVSAVRSHLQCDVQFGALLSGGVDSSIVSAVATKIMRERDPTFRLKTYSVGLENAPDFKYSRMVAEYINSDHKEVVFKVEDGLDCIREVIYHTETYDVTTVRCSIPMVLLARAIKAEGLKMILSGEGADEIFGGYLYFFNAPNYEEFHHETVKRVLGLHFSDCLRANKSTMSYGVELRVPFLDNNFVDHAMSIRPEDRIPGAKNQFASRHSTRAARIEKHILRASFTDAYLPDEVLWRQKEQFSDGVGYAWIDTIREYATARVTDEEFSCASKLYPINTPSTKEAFYYRAIFEEMFPGDAYASTVMRWIPRRDWGCPEDPSGRAQKVHTAAI